MSKTKIWCCTKKYFMSTKKDDAAHTHKKNCAQEVFFRSGAPYIDRSFLDLNLYQLPYPDVDSRGKYAFLIETKKKVPLFP